MLHTEFRLARQATEGWAHSQEALDQYARDELGDLRNIFREAGRQQAWVFTDEKRIEEYLEHVRSQAPQRVDEVQRRFAQHRYILHVSIFENFLKAIHREILRATPALLRSDRNVELGRLVAKGQDTVIAEEIEREVDSLDRQTAEKKSRYFEQKLGISWFDGKAAPVLEAVVRLRNIVLHEDPDRPVDEKDQVLVSAVSTGVIFASVAAAAILYPAVCDLPLGLDAERAKLYLAKRKPNPSESRPLP